MLLMLGLDFWGASQNYPTPQGKAFIHESQASPKAFTSIHLWVTLALTSLDFSWSSHVVISKSPWVERKTSLALELHLCKADGSCTASAASIAAGVRSTKKHFATLRLTALFIKFCLWESTLQKDSLWGFSRIIS